MSIDLTKFKRGPEDEFDDRLWSSFVEEVALVLNSIQEKAVSFDVARQQLIEAALFRVNEILLPAFDRVFAYQTAGFLNAPILPDSEVPYVTGNTAIGIHPDYRDLFRPTPFVALTRSSTEEDVAIAQTISYDEGTGALVLNIVDVIGGAGPFSDVIVTATAGSVQAQQHFLAQTKAARDLAGGYATAASGSAGAASGSAGTASAAAGAAADSAGYAAAARALAEKWASEAENTVVADGRYSASHYALKAAASAVLAATFDPSNYWTKGQSYSAAQADAADDAWYNAALSAVAGIYAPQNGLIYATEFFLNAGTDLDGLLTPGHYSGYTLTHAPEGSGAVFYVQVYKHAALDDFVLQVATDGTSGALPRRFIRRRNAGTWSAWREITFEIATQAQVRSNTAGKILGVQEAHASQDWVNLTDATTVAFDMAAGVNRKLTLGGNRTLGQITNARPGQSFCIEVSQPGSTSTRTLSYHSSYVTPASGITIKTGDNVKTLLTGIVLAVSGTTATKVFICQSGDGWTA